MPPSTAAAARHGDGTHDAPAETRSRGAGPVGPALYQVTEIML